MQTSIDCIPCFLRQALEAARFFSDSPAVHERIVREVLEMAGRLDWHEPPPVVGQRIHRRLRELTGHADPYRPIKERHNRMALALLPELADKIADAEDPLVLAAHLAIAGNIIDLGVNGQLTEDEVHAAIENALAKPLVGDPPALRAAFSEASHVLYLADNAGEIVFDRLLIEQLGPSRVTVAVRGQAVLNDATFRDAEAAGLSELVEVIDNGSDAPGTILSDCSEAFRSRFAQADLIIAKGQGNYETLSNTKRSIFFLFRVKCPVIAADVGYPVGTHLALAGGSNIRIQ